MSYVFDIFIHKHIALYALHISTALVTFYESQLYMKNQIKYNLIVLFRSTWRTKWTFLNKFRA